MHPIATVLLAATLAGAASQRARSPQDPAPAAPAPVDARQLQRLAWLSGTWVLQRGDTTIEEHWRPLQGTTLLGSSHTFTAERTQFFEHLRITAMRDTIAYLAMPGGRPPTAFLLTKLDDGVVEFENAKHDHPQRIRYEKTAKGVTATVCQLDGSRAEVFAYERR